MLGEVMKAFTGAKAMRTAMTFWQITYGSLGEGPSGRRFQGFGTGFPSAW